jgi:hypothetical protein
MVAILFAGWSVDAAADPPPAGPATADAAMARYQQWLHGSETAACTAPGQASDEDIVVCGRHSRKPPERSPLPVSREPGEIVRHIGEGGGGTMSDCVFHCPQALKIDVIGAARAVPKIIDHILGKDD